MAAFCTYVYRAVKISSNPSNRSNERNCLKSLALSWGYNLSVNAKALMKFKMPKCFVCHSDLYINPVVLPFYFSISFKIPKIISGFGFKVSFKLVNKIKLSSFKNPFLTENWSGFLFWDWSENFVPCSYCNHGYTAQLRRRLKARLDEYPRTVEESYSSTIASHCWSYKHNFNFTKGLFSVFSHFHTLFDFS